MQPYLTIAGSVIVTIGTLPYLVDIIRGRTKPKLVTWATWSLLNFVNLAVTIANSAWQSGLLSLMTLACTLSVVALGFKSGAKTFSKFDIVCQITALVGLFFWFLASQSSIAVALVIIIDLAGTLPTFYHAWRAPYEETVQSFALGAFGSFLVMVSLQELTFVSAGFPIYFFLAEFMMTLTILFRRQ